MTQASQRVAVEDVLSRLPRNVIDRILELLPVHDAARTSILSRNWRYVWAMTPYLVLDKLFFKTLGGKSRSVINKIVDKILLQHLGDIVKFVLDISETPRLSSDEDIDRWMLYVTRHGVKDLTLHLSNGSTYRLPSYILNCLTLTNLKLLNCVIHPPLCFLGFQNLVTLSMEKVTFIPTTKFCVINAPLLLKLMLRWCIGTQNLKMVSSRLKFLVIRQSQYDCELNNFTNCKNMTVLSLVVENPNTNDNDERSTLQKLLCSLPKLEVLTLGSFFIELLSAGTVPNGLPFTLNSLWHLRLGVHLGKVGQACYALELIKSFPNLSKLEILGYASSDIAEAVNKYLDTTSCLDRPLSKLKVVVMLGFTGSKAEFHFIKLLFAYTPSLLRMSIWQNRAISSSEERNITKQLMRFPRASPKAELFYFPNAG